jgi:hemolysin III
VDGEGVSSTVLANGIEVRDFGPLYRETDMSGWPVEPWATYSNLIFLLIFIYWGARVVRRLREQRFIAFCLPFLFVGFVGGTVYHATRSHPVWLLLDFLPILFLCVCASVYYWRKLHTHWLLIVVAVAAPIMLVRGLALLLGLPQEMQINLGYASLAVPIVLPIVLHAVRRRQRAAWLVAGALACFAVAVLFRHADLRVPSAVFPMGTHWLWHVFGGVSTHLLIWYVYLDNRAAPART